MKGNVPWERNDSLYYLMPIQYSPLCSHRQQKFSFVCAYWNQQRAACTIEHTALMEIYFQLVSDAEGLRKACDELKNAEYLGFDVETTELDPYRGELRLVQLSDG